MASDLRTTQVQVPNPITNESAPVIQIGLVESLIGIVVFIFTIGVAWGSLKTQIKNIAAIIGRIEPDLKDVRERFAAFEGKLSGAFGASSPISLKPIGQEALLKSGLKKWIDDHKDELLTKCKTANTMDNQYDIQEAAFKFFDHVDLGDFENELKQAAFNFGWTLETMRRVGGIYFRDLCLKERNFTPEDLDKPQT